MPRVLGVHIGHDASAALVVGGEIVASVCEERFNRVKHYGGIPTDAIEYCLAEGGISIDDVDEVAFCGKAAHPQGLQHIMSLDIPQERWRSRVKEILDDDGFDERGLRDRFVSVAKQAYRAASSSREEPPLYYVRWIGKRKIPVRFVDHHLAHAASAFYTSGRDEALVITADGIGDGTSLAVWRASAPSRFDLLYRAGAGGSLGWFYGLITEGLGWWVGDGEGKTMGLAPYGSSEGVEGVLDKFCPRYRHGRLVAPHDFGRISTWSEKGTSHWHFPESEEVKALVDRHGAEAIAAEAQRVLEREMVPVITAWLKHEGTRDACFAGGLFLNVKLNQRVWESGAIDVQHIFPDAGDGGLAAGAALLGSAALGGSLRSSPIGDAYWGPAYDDAEIEYLLNERRIPFQRTSDPAGDAAELLADGRIVAWFQGRMEAGPRALGGRSILMDPTKAENKDIINSRVKFREAFRPFCPSMTPDAAEELLEYGARHELFMITSFTVRDDQRGRVPAVVHADGTARPQVVNEEVNPLFHRLLVEFGRRTGVECLLNTSFNIKGEPIVCNPRDAIRCFFDTGLDSLVLGGFVLDKRS